VALGYKQLPRVEESFRRLEHGTEIRPVRHRTPERTEAHVFACVPALLLERVAELGTGRRWGGDPPRAWTPEDGGRTPAQTAGRL
jgi:hypothetical protein